MSNIISIEDHALNATAMNIINKAIDLGRRREKSAAGYIDYPPTNETFLLNIFKNEIALYKQPKIETKTT